MCHAYTVDFYSAIKKNKIMKFASKLMKLRNMKPSEVTQTQEGKYVIYDLICNS